MLETKDIIIGDRRARITQLGAVDARRVARRLLSVIGSAVKASGSSADGISEALEARIDVMAGLGTLLEELDDETLDFLHNTFAKATHIERTPGSEDWVKLDDRAMADTVFGGGAGLVAWFAWLTDCLKWSVGDFFREAGGVVKGLLPAAATSQRNASPNTSTGSSTVSPRPIGTRARS